jgi:hypothetical protein
MENKKINQIKEGIEQNKWLVGLVLGVLAVFVVLILLNKKPDVVVSTVEGCRPGDLFSQTSGKPCQDEKLASCLEGDVYDRTTGKPCGEPKINTSTEVLGYEAALKAFSGKSFIFNEECISPTKELEVIKNSKVLIANNSTRTLEIYTPTREKSLLPYHYMTVFLGDIGENTISCNGVVSGVVNVK